MRQVLKEELTGQRYTGDSAPQLSASVADCIRKRLEGGRRQKTGAASYNPSILKSIDSKPETSHFMYTDFWEADEGQTGWLRRYYGNTQCLVGVMRDSKAPDGSLHSCNRLISVVILRNISQQIWGSTAISLWCK